MAPSFAQVNRCPIATLRSSAVPATRVGYSETKQATRFYTQANGLHEQFRLQDWCSHFDAAAA
jgi:hypothetical protein